MVAYSCAKETSDNAAQYDAQRHGVINVISRCPRGRWKGDAACGEGTATDGGGCGTWLLLAAWHATERPAALAVGDRQDNTRGGRGGRGGASIKTHTIHKRLHSACIEDHTRSLARARHIDEPEAPLILTSKSRLMFVIVQRIGPTRTQTKQYLNFC